MLIRRLSVALLLGCAACQNPGDRMEILPMTLGEWKRVTVENIPPEEHKEELKQRGIKRSRRGVYQGAFRITATVYEFGAPAVAFEMVQKWKPEPRSIVLHEGPYFVILQTDNDDVRTMNGFATVLEAELKR